MCKKIIGIVFFIICVAYMWCVNSRPMFDLGKNDFEVYVNGNSSNAIIKRVNELEYIFCFNRYGESCEISESVNADDFFKTFNAKIVKIEQGEFGTNYYAYSSKIKYCVLLFGEKVNLHLFLGNTVKVGSPLIFGSY